MTNERWGLVQVAARLLEPGDREAVVGDLLEAGEDAGRASLDVLGLAVRRQLQHWRSWQPWLAAFGLALPGSFVLMGISVSLSLMSMRLIGLNLRGGASPAVHGDWLPIAGAGALLVGCSWCCGFALGSLSRRTLWAGLVASCFACSLCFVRFREPSLSSLCLFLFLPPAIWGVCQGRRSLRINPLLAISLAIATTVLLVPQMGKSVWTLNWCLVWPAWYIVARQATRRKRIETETGRF